MRGAHLTRAARAARQQGSPPPKRPKSRSSNGPAKVRLIGRQTVPGPSGRQYPIVLGDGTTSLLMFLAMNRGATALQIQAALEIKKGSFHTRMRRLRESGVIVGTYWYQINTSLRNEKALVLFLRALAEAHGMTWIRGTYGERTTVARADRVFVPPPRELFGTRNRTRILMALAALHESYVKELHEVLRIHKPSVRNALEQLRIEGVLRLRDVGRLKSYSLDPTYPGAEHLLTFLRLECKAEPAMTAAVNAALARRIEVQRAGRRSDVNKFAELERAALATTIAPKGVERKWQPRQRWKRLHGDWNGERFAPSRRGRHFRLTDEEHALFRRLVLGEGRVRGRLLAWARALGEHLEKHDRIRTTTDLYHWLFHRLVVSKAPMRRSDASKIAIVGLRAEDSELPDREEWRRAVLEQVPRVAAHRAREFLATPRVGNDRGSAGILQP
jgi:DNA-binding transcriptional ArsR family regulator